MKLTNIKRDSEAHSFETKLAAKILELYADCVSAPANTRVIVIVSRHDDEADRGRAGVAYDGYDNDEQVMVTLGACLAAIDLGGDK